MIRGRAALAVALAMAGGFMGGAVEVLRPAPRQDFGWVPPRRQSKAWRERARIAAPSRLIRHGYAGESPPVSAPSGYFWMRDAVGTRWRLYRRPFHTNTPGKARDRGDGVLVVTSSWGYLKPRIMWREEFEAEQERIRA